MALRPLLAVVATGTSNLCMAFRGACPQIFLITMLAQLGYAVPKDIKVAVFDDVNYATISAPALTTAHQPCDGLADLAFEMLMARIDRPDAPPRQTFLDTLLVVRESAKVVRKSHA